MPNVIIDDINLTGEFAEITYCPPDGPPIYLGYHQLPFTWITTIYVSGGTFSLYYPDLDLQCGSCNTTTSTTSSTTTTTTAFIPPYAACFVDCCTDELYTVFNIPGSVSLTIGNVYLTVFFSGEERCGTLSFIGPCGELAPGFSYGSITNQDTCEKCIESYPCPLDCYCYSIENTTPDEITYTYVDCDTETVMPGAVPGNTTVLQCALDKTIIPDQEGTNVTEIGLCSEGCTTTTSSSTTTTTTEAPPAICPNVFEVVVEPTIDTLDFQLYGYDATFALIDGTVDWGDGSPIDTFSGANFGAPQHTYAAPGTYTIIWTVNIICDNSFYVDFWSEREISFPTSIQSRITSITSILNPNPTTLIVKGQGAMLLDFQNSVQFNLTIEGQNPANPLSITNVIDVSTATILYVVSFTYASAAGLLLPASQSNGTFTLSVDYGNNVFLNDMLVAADASGMVNQAFSSFSSGSASGAGLTAYNNLVTKGWTMNIIP